MLSNVNVYCMMVSSLMHNIMFIDIALLAGNDIRKSCAISVVAESVIMEHV